MKSITSLTNVNPTKLFEGVALKVQAYVYLLGASGVSKISIGAELIIMTEIWFCAKTIGGELVFTTSKVFSSVLLKKYNIKESSFRNSLVSLCKKGILIKGGRSEYKLNPNSFGELNGEPLTFTYCVKLQ